MRDTIKCNLSVKGLSTLAEEVNKTAKSTKKILVTRDLVVALMLDHPKLVAELKKHGVEAR